MKIQYLAHAAFLITAENGTRILTDPYETGGEIKYDDITEKADIVTVSHEHFDHRNVGAVGGSPTVVRKTAQVGSISFRGIQTAHDEAGGEKRGGNTMFCFSVDGVNICHAGDLGHLLNDKQVKETGKVDVLLIPVGGYFTIDAKTASKVCEQLKPKVVIPMHYKTDRIKLTITGVEDFLKGKDNVSRLNASEVEIRADKLPASTMIMVLKPAKG